MKFFSEKFYRRNSTENYLIKRLINFHVVRWNLKIWMVIFYIDVIPRGITVFAWIYWYNYRKLCWGVLGTLNCIALLLGGNTDRRETEITVSK